MNAPFLSVVVPAYNEDARVAQTISTITAEFDRLAISAELIIVDDGSTDRTASLVADASRLDARVKLIHAAHAGKGAAVRRGMVDASGAWRFFADADLSMPIAELVRFIGPGHEGPSEDVLVGSREAAGASRTGEPWSRHAIGRVFNWMVRLLVLRGIADTQCGFKLFSARAAQTLFPLQRLDGFGFDVEILFLARRAGFVIEEIPVTWEYSRKSKVSMASGARGFLDLLAIRWNQFRGAYPPPEQGHPARLNDAGRAGRSVLLLTLLAAYVAVIVRLAGGGAVDRSLDALAPQARAVEQAIGERRFADALPVALELQRAHEDEPLVAYWLATIFHGLDRPRDEVIAWEAYIRLSSQPLDACPAIAEAYERVGDHARALQQYQDCVAYDPAEPDSLVDLGEALERDQKIAPALAAYRSAALLDPHNPALARRIDQLSQRTDVRR